jgi:hypothetical protein
VLARGLPVASGRCAAAGAAMPPHSASTAHASVIHGITAPLDVAIHRRQAFNRSVTSA